MKRGGGGGVCGECLDRSNINTDLQNKLLSFLTLEICTDLLRNRALKHKETTSSSDHYFGSMLSSRGRGGKKRNHSMSVVSSSSSSSFHQ